MAAPLTASSQVRDIQIDVKESCNCCCWKKPKFKSLPVYVHENGRVEAFNARRAGANIHATYARSHDNLTRVIGEMARHRLFELATVWEEAAKRGVSMNRDMPLMMQTVRDLVDIIDEVSTPKH